MTRNAATADAYASEAQQSAADRIAELLVSAMQFVPRDRSQPMIRKWLAGCGLKGLSDKQYMAMAADSALLSADLLLSQPSASGATAFDRLAKSCPKASPADRSTLDRLCKSQFRLLRLEGDSRLPEIMLRDVVSNEALRAVGATWPKLAVGTMLFGRVVMLRDGVCCLPGSVTPLDDAAFAVARAHPCSSVRNIAAGARWAEALYGHVVRNGTLDVPELNRPADFGAPDDVFFADDNNELTRLALLWAKLAGETADADLLQDTRALADLRTIVEVLTMAVRARDKGEGTMAAAYERMLLVQMETIQRRERGGSGTLSLDMVGRALDEAIAAKVMPASVRALFVSLQKRVSDSGGARRAGDPALERLVQRIQGLRAKTVAQGCTEQEALSAAEKVGELLDRYGLSLSELDFRAQPCEGVGIQTDRKRFAPIDSCIPAIAAFFDCRVWVERAPGAPLRYVFFGLRGDVAAAQYLYEMVERAFVTETDTFRAGKLYAEMAGERRSASNSFQVGMAQGIASKLQTMRGARDATRCSASGRDLVPVKAAMVDEEVAKLGLDLRARAVGQRKMVLSDAFTQGEVAGQRFEFMPAITKAA